MKILLISEKEFLKELALIRYNLKNHTGIFQTTEIGKINSGLLREKIILDKDIEILEKVDGILICNFKKGKQENYIGNYSLILASIAYFLNKKIYILYDLPKLKVKEINFFQPIVLKGDLKKIM